MSPAMTISLRKWLGPVCIVAVAAVVASGQEPEQDTGREARFKAAKRALDLRQVG